MPRRRRAGSWGVGEVDAVVVRVVGMVGVVAAALGMVLMKMTSRVQPAIE